MLGLKEISEAEFDKVMAPIKELISRNKELKAEIFKVKQVGHSGGLLLKLSIFMTNTSLIAVCSAVQLSWYMQVC